MNRPNILAVMAGMMLLAGNAAFAQQQTDSTPPMHMHKSDMDHRSDKEVATEYKSEATQLREKAESHRKLAKLYQVRTPSKGGVNYEAASKHCYQLAKLYEEAAKEAEGVAGELNK
jgi:hypothetical protein